MKETDYLLLVPEKYHEKVKEIYDYYYGIANETGQHSEDGEDNSHDTAESKNKRDVKIIWIKNGQNFFTYSLEINPNSGNCVKDPVVRVLTEHNGILSDYNRVAGYMTNPLKIKVTDIENPTPEIMKEFRKYYDLSKINFPVRLVYQTVEAEIQLMKRQIQTISFVMLLLITMIGAIILHNVTIYYEQNRLKLAIEQFHGYKLFDKFKGYLLGIYISWAAIMPISILIYRKLYILPIIIVMFLFEIVISLLLFSKVEKRKILKITKGG